MGQHHPAGCLPQVLGCPLQGAVSERKQILSLHGSDSELQLAEWKPSENICAPFFLFPADKRVWFFFFSPYCCCLMLALHTNAHHSFHPPIRNPGRLLSRGWDVPLKPSLRNQPASYLGLRVKGFQFTHLMLNSSLWCPGAPGPAFYLLNSGSALGASSFIKPSKINSWISDD